jgi:integrase
MPKELFRLGRYWIATVPGSGNLYRFWYDARSGEVRRRSLGTGDLEQAKIELAKRVLAEGSGRASEPKDVLLSVVLDRYWTEHTDLRRNAILPRTAGRYVLEDLGLDAKVSDFTRSRQVAFLKRLHARGLSVGYIGRLMGSLQAALNFAVARDDEDEGKPLLRAPKVIYGAKRVAEALHVAEPDEAVWHPDLATVARWLDGLKPNEEHLRRWTILIIGFGGCRAEAAREAGMAQVDATHRIIRLNPAGRRQTNKHRPTVPICDALWPLLQAWSSTARFVGEVGDRYPGDRWIAARTRIGLPEAFTPRSLRHAMATELRHAHKRHGVPRVPTDEIEMLQGHRRASMNARYGVFEPDYLEGAKLAVNAILVALDGHCSRPFLPHTGAKLRVVR